MKTKKTLLPILASALLLTMGLAACGKTEGGNSSGNQQSSEVEEVKINVTAEGDKKELQVGETVQLRADVEGVEWSTRAEGVLSVDANGVVTALGAGSGKVTAKKDGYANGSITITVAKAPERAAAHEIDLELAEHYSPNDFWGMNYGGTVMGPGDSPVEDNSGATEDSHSLGWLQQGCKETLKFTANKAIQVEIGVKMAYNTAMDLNSALSVKFNNQEISMAGKSTEAPETEGSYYEFHTVSFGNVTLVNGENTLEIEMIGQGPNMDVFQIFTEDKELQITAIPATAKPKIEVVAAELSVEVGKTAQIEVKNNLTGVTYTSADPTIAEVSATGLVTGVKKGKTTVEVTKDGYKKASVAITVTKAPAANEIILEAEDAILPEGSTIQMETSAEGSGGQSLGYFGEGQTFELKYTAAAAVEADLTLVAAPCSLKSDYSGIAEMNLAEAMELKLNNNAISLADKVLPEVSGWNFQNWNDVDLGKVNLIEGENVFYFKALTQGPNIDCLKLTLPGATVSVTPVADNTADEQGVTYLELENGEFVRPENADESQNLVVEDSETAHGAKSLGYVNAGNKVTLKFTASAAGKVNFRLTAAATKFFFDMTTYTMGIADHPLEECMSLKLNDNEIDLTDVVLPGNTENNYKNWHDINFGDIDVQQGLNTLVFEISAQGPNMDCVKLKASDSVVLSLPTAQ